MFGSETTKSCYRKLVTRTEMHLVRWRRHVDDAMVQVQALRSQITVPMMIIIMPNEHVLFHFLRNFFSWFRLPYDSLVKRPRRPSMLRYLPSCRNAKHFKAQLFLLLVSIRFFLLWNSFSMFLHWSCFALGQRSPTSALLLIFHLHFWQRAHVARRILCSTNTQVRSITRNRTKQRLFLYFIIVACFMTRAHYFPVSLKIHKSWNLILFALGKMDFAMPFWLIVSVRAQRNMHSGHLA